MFTPSPFNSGLMCGTSSLILVNAWYYPKKIGNYSSYVFFSGGFMIGYLYGVLEGPIIPALFIKSL
tara:strand:+ start:1253 stop:1450 length:198 start_codon:yes stop_codon:yes gene_type:complete